MAPANLADVPPSRAGADPSWLAGVRLHVVTGKGGTGKTAVAAALALALAAGGRRVLLAEVEERDGLARLLGTEGLDATEKVVRRQPGGGRISAVSIDPRGALQEYLERYYRLGVAGKIAEKAGAVDFAASVAPGLRDVLITGKVYEAVERKELDGLPSYDAVVLDAPPTGRVTKFLNVNSEIGGLARVGPVHNQASSVMELLRSPRTAVHLVALPEEMPVTEAMETMRELDEIGLPTGVVLLNQAREPVLTLAGLKAAGQQQLDEAEVAEQLGRFCEPRTALEIARALVADATEHAERIATQRRLQATLRKAGRPVLTVPYLSEGLNATSVSQLAEAIREQGLCL